MLKVNCKEGVLNGSDFNVHPLSSVNKKLIGRGKPETELPPCFILYFDYIIGLPFPLFVCHKIHLTDIEF